MSFSTHVHERHLSGEGTTAPADTSATDVVVIGAGPVGENAAGRVAAGGLGVVLVEADLVGGECSYWACMPSKALLRPVAALAAARRLPGAREAVSGEVDTAAVFGYRDTFTSGWSDASQVSWAVGAGITLVRGRARLTGVRAVEVTSPDGSTTTITAEHAVIVATGSVPTTPRIEGLASVPHWGSREATSAKDVPPRLAVIGGGVVGCELAQAFAGLGSSVTLLTPSTLLGRMEARAGELVADALREAGVDVRLGSTITAVSRDSSDGPVTIITSDGPVVADELLVATGRRPATDDLGLESVGLTAGQPLAVDTTGLVAALDQGGSPWLYAAGDVTGLAPLTHMGKYSARATGDVVAARAAGRPVRDEPWGKHASTAQQRAITQVVFTDPEVTSVGLTAAQAAQAGLRTRVVDLDIAVAGSSVHAQGYTGWARMVTDEDAGTVVGVTFVGQDTSELIHSATVAVVGEVPLERLWHAVPSFPTISEVWLRLLEAYGL